MTAKMDDASVAKILDLGRERMPTRAIATEVGCSYRHVARVLRGNGIEPMGNPRNPSLKRPNLIEDAEWLIRSGEHPEHMAKRLGFGTVNGLLRALSERDRDDLAAEVRKLDRSSHAYFLSCPWPTDGDRAKKVPA